MITVFPGRNWSEPVTLAAEELWQVRRGAVAIVTGTPTSLNDGVVLTPKSEPLRLPAGIAVRVREEVAGSRVPPLLVRISLGDVAEVPPFEFPDVAPPEPTLEPPVFQGSPAITPSTPVAGSPVTIAEPILTGRTPIDLVYEVLPPSGTWLSLQSRTYTPTVGGQHRWRVTATNEHGSAQRTVDFTVGVVPDFTVAPRLTSTSVALGSPLGVVSGEHSGTAPLTVLYETKLNSTSTWTTITLPYTPVDLGDQQLRVTVSNTYGSKTFTASYTVNAVAPTATPPVVSGSMANRRVGSTLDVTAGTVTGQPLPTVTMTVTRPGGEVVPVTNSRYQLVGQGEHTATQTATNVGGTVTRTTTFTSYPVLSTTEPLIWTRSIELGSIARVGDFTATGDPTLSVEAGWVLPDETVIPITLTGTPHVSDGSIRYSTVSQYTPEALGVHYLGVSLTDASGTLESTYEFVVEAEEVPETYVRSSFLDLDAPTIHSGHSLTDTYANQPWPGAYHLSRQSVLGTTLPTARSVKSTIPGSTGRWRLDHPLETPEDAFRDIALYRGLVYTERTLIMPTTGPEDVTQYREDLTAALTFFRNALDNGTETLVYYSNWPYLDVGAIDWRAQLELYGDYYTARADYCTSVLRSEFPGLPSNWRVWMMPGHRILMRVYDDIVAGLVPGVTSIDQLFQSDNIHPVEGGLLSVMLGYAAMVVLHGTRLPDYPSLWANTLTTAQAAYARSTVWSIVSTYARCGLLATDPGEHGWVAGVDPDPFGAVDPTGDQPPADAKLIWTPTQYIGPALSGTPPTVENGYLRMNNSNRNADLALENGYYVFLYMRMTAWPEEVAGHFLLTSNNVTTYAKPNSAVIYSGWPNPNQSYIQAQPVEGEGNWGSIGAMIDDSPVMLEGWHIGTEMGGSLDAGGEMTATSDVPTGPTTQIQLFYDLYPDVKAVVILDRKPTPAERSALYGWAAALA